MNKKGFTLVELLAVVIILSLLVLITSTSVTKVLKDSKNKLSDAQIVLIEDAAKAWSADNLGKMDDTDSCLYLTVKDLKDYGLLSDELKDPKNSKKIKDDVKVKINKKQGNLGNSVIDYEINPKSIKGCSYIRYFANGTPVYFDVKEGKGCTEKEYAKSFEETKNDYLNSSTGYNGITESNEKQNSCLKFYAFNDDKSDTIDLLLDHNTTVDIMWNSSGENKEGPKEIIDKLKEDTKDWKGTIEPLPYTVDQRDKTSTAYYTINYEGFKARLITYEDLNKIDNNLNKKENLWLFDRITNICNQIGCENNSDDTNITGYYTATSISSIGTSVYALSFANTPVFFLIDKYPTDTTLGIRPVIKVYKSDLIENAKKKENTINDICTPVTSTTKTSGNIPKGNYENGDEYICEVRPGAKYRFYVISRQNVQGELISDNSVDKKATSINLIMDQNINSDGTPAGMTGIEKNGDNVYNLVAWINQGDYESVGGQNWSSWTDNNAFGPITAMNFLSEATKTWINTNEIKTSTIAYENGTTYTMSKTYYTNARMPIYSSDASKTEVADKTESNAYLYTNLDPEGMNAPFGYWTLSPRAEHSFGAWFASCDGGVNDGVVGSANDYGVRPVINLKI